MQAAKIYHLRVRERGRDLKVNGEEITLSIRVESVLTSHIKTENFLIVYMFVSHAQIKFKFFKLFC